MAEGCAAPRRELTRIFPGSWIDANFYIWIGHADDQRGWSQLADARQALEAAAREAAVDPVALAGAREEVLIAEGSDWFWWYGDDHSSDQDLEFDDLFRRHLRNVYRLLRKPVPDELFVSNISRPRRAAGRRPPRWRCWRRRSTAKTRATSNGSAPARWRFAASLSRRGDAPVDRRSVDPDARAVRLRAHAGPAVRPAGRRPSHGRPAGRRLRVLAEVPAAGRRPVRGADGGRAGWSERSGIGPEEGDGVDRARSTRRRRWRPGRSSRRRCRWPTWRQARTTRVAFFVVVLAPDRVRGRDPSGASSD